MQAMSDPDSNDKPRSGRVRHDAGGRAIWEWAVDSGRSAVDSTSRLLKKLELTGITLMGDEARPWEKRSGEDASHGHGESRGGSEGHARGGSHGPDPAAQAAPKHDPEQARGTNPYDSRTPVKRGAPSPKATPPSARHVPQKGESRTGPKPGLLARLFGRK